MSNGVKVIKIAKSLNSVYNVHHIKFLRSDLIFI